jgi:hydrogenase maturation factor
VPSIGWTQVSPMIGTVIYQKLSGDKKIKSIVAGLTPRDDVRCSQ